MSMLCKLGGHEADRGEIWNAGYYFSACRRCGHAMIRSGGGWQAVPAGHRVVWKRGHHRHSVATAFRINVPVPLPSAARSPFAAWNRQLMALAGRNVEDGRASRADEHEEAPYPYFLALAAILGAGLQLLLRAGPQPRSLG